jgi:hypothetical protein
MCMVGDLFANKLNEVLWVTLIEREVDSEHGLIYNPSKRGKEVVAIHFRSVRHCETLLLLVARK